MEIRARREIEFLACTGSAALAERLRGMMARWTLRECVASETNFADTFPQGGADADVLFLDMDSVDVPEDDSAGKTTLIVVSGDAGNAIRSYRWHPAAFLKPDFTERQLAQALDAAERSWEDGWLCLELPLRRRLVRMPVGRVRYVEAQRNYCLLNQKKQPLRLRVPLGELEWAIPQPPFARCHKSYLVHLDAVEKMTYTSLTLKDDGVRLPVGRSYHDALRGALEAWKRGTP